MIYFIGFILGLVCSFGQPPFNYVMTSIGSIALFLSLLMHKENKQSSIGFSYSFGYGYFIYSIHWFNESLLTFGDKLLWLVPFGLLLIPAFFALYFALFGFLVRRYSFGNNFLVALIWLFAELIRSYLYIEFPWLLAGYIWSNSKIISQSVSLFGIWGLSFLTILWACAVKDAISRTRLKNFAYIVTAFISFIFCYGYGINHLKEELKPNNISIKIVQPNIDPNLDHRINSVLNNLQKTIDLSGKSDDVNYVIWPEGANLYYLDHNLIQMLKDYSPQNGALIFSSSHFQKDPVKYWNSLFIINKQGEVLDYYDKVHLVPLGEYIPFSLRTLLPFVNKITPGDADFSVGEKIKTIKTHPAFLPSICYEDAFPETIAKDYQWIVNVTNDGWFGSSIGPYQHLAISKFRSIEQGVPMARAALTGISAVINSFGEIEQSLPLKQSGVIKAALPGYNHTYYHYYGNYMLLLLIGACFFWTKEGQKQEL